MCVLRYVCFQICVFLNMCVLKYVWKVGRLEGGKVGKLIETFEVCLKGLFCLEGAGALHANAAAAPTLHRPLKQTNKQKKQTKKKTNKHKNKQTKQTTNKLNIIKVFYYN